jgi:hypothetical protein
LVIFTRDFGEVAAGRVDSQYLVGSDSFFGHSIQKPFFRIWLGALVVSMRGAYADGGESRA